MTANRILRNRHGNLFDTLDRQRKPDAEPTSRMAAQIYDGGHMSAGGDRYYLAHPISFAGTETEGGTDAGTVDTNTSMTIFVLGGASAGDVVNALAVGNRWVARKGSTSTLCCNCAWPCGGFDTAPLYITVTDPRYGAFRLDLSIPSPNLCLYHLDTHINTSFGPVAVAMQIVAHGNATFFEFWINDQGASNGCGNVGNIPPQTPCDCDFPNFIHEGGCPDAPGLPYITIPTANNTFPAGAWNQGLCGVTLNGIGLELDCTKLRDPSRPSFSVEGTIYQSCLDSIDTNPFYLLYGACPAPAPPFGPLCSVTPSWTFQAGPLAAPPTKTLMCQHIHVNGCATPGYPGVTVTVSDTSGGVASGVTDSMGNCSLSWPGLPGNYTVDLADFSTRFLPYPSAQFSMICNGTTTINLSPLVASGYVCTAGCLLPLPTTLMATFTGTEVVDPPVTCTMIYQPPGSPLVGWVIPPGPGPCASLASSLLTPGLEFILHGNGAVQPTISAVCPPSLDLVFGNTGLFEIEITE